MIITRQSKILVLGVNGQVGSALNVLLDNVICLGREHADLSRPETLPEIIKLVCPDVLINAAAYTQVDKAESEKEIAFAVNALSPEILAQTAVEMNIPFVHYSTDYVFDGTGKEPWSETDKTSPINVYGASKLAGEEAVVNAGGKYLIFRTSWVYNARGKNFLNSMLRLGAEREILKVVGDQYGAPTYAPHLAQATINGLDNAMAQIIFPAGIYNLCAGGETSWYGFAQEIFAQAHNIGIVLKLKNLEKIPAIEYPLPTPRPYNSRLNCSKAKEILGVTFPDWKMGVLEAIKEKIQCT